MMKRIFSYKNQYSILYTALVCLVIMSCGGSDDSPDPTPASDNPTAAADTLTVEEDSAAGTTNQINVSTNDSIGDDGGDGDDYALASEPTNGTITEVSDGVFEYIPNANYSGTDSFTYTITDSNGDQDTATVTITVNQFVPSADSFNNIDPNLPSFVSIRNTTPEGKQWVKSEETSDEFDAWNPSKWIKTTWNYDPPVFMSASDDNSGVADGNLWIKAILNESNPEDRWFQTARIRSTGLINYPVYIESRIKTAHISAYNTFWLNNGDSDNRDEIDIIENNSNPSCNCQPDFPSQMNSQYFHVVDNLTPQTIRNKGDFNRSGLSDTNPLKNVNWNEGFHIYGAWWKDSKNVQFYLDGEPAGSIVVGEHQTGDTFPNREFTRELFVYMGLWTFDAPWLGGLPQKSELSDDTVNTMRIDYVRTWELQDM